MWTTSNGPKANCFCGRQPAIIIRIQDQIESTGRTKWAYDDVEIARLFITVLSWRVSYSIKRLSNRHLSHSPSRCQTIAKAICAPLVETNNRPLEKGTWANRTPTGFRKKCRLIRFFCCICECIYEYRVHNRRDYPWPSHCFLFDIIFPCG